MARGHPAETNPGTGEQGRWELSRPAVNPEPVSEPRKKAKGRPEGRPFAI
jgi:hypothetical protein